MAQLGDYSVDNQSGSLVRGEINTIFGDVKSMNAGSTDPSSPVEGMMYPHTTGHYFKIYHQSTWVQLPIAINSDNTMFGFTTSGDITITAPGTLTAIDAEFDAATTTEATVLINQQLPTMPALRLQSDIGSNAYTGDILQIDSYSTSSLFDFITCYSDIDASSDREFRVSGNGNVYADGTFTPSGADYAEFMEWADGNEDEETRVGLTVAIDAPASAAAGAARIRPAVDGDTVIGVVSASPAVVGNAASLKWSKRYLRDQFGAPILDSSSRRQLNPEFDSEAPYKPRAERREWAPVGLIGQLRIRKGQAVNSRWIKLCDVSDDVEEWLIR